MHQVHRDEFVVIGIVPLCFEPDTADIGDGPDAEEEELNCSAGIRMLPLSIAIVPAETDAAAEPDAEVADQSTAVVGPSASAVAVVVAAAAYIAMVAMAHCA